MTIEQIAVRLQKLKQLKKWKIYPHIERNTIYLLYPKKDRDLATPFAKGVRQLLTYYGALPDGIRIRSASQQTFETN